MNSQPNFAQPPRIAVWLISLFTSADEAESMSGDLHEEFHHLVAKSGVAFAHGWYWRQTGKTIVHLVARAFRVAPWSTSAAVLGGYLLLGFMSRFAQQGMQAFLDAHRMYELHPDAYLFWLKFPLQAGRVILCVLVGGCVALAARGREMAAVVGLGLVQLTLFFAAVVAVIAGGHVWFDWVVEMLLLNLLCSVATVVGGAIVTMRRSATRTPRSAT